MKEEFLYICLFLYETQEHPCSMFTHMSMENRANVSLVYNTREF